MRQQGLTKGKGCEHRWTLRGIYRCHCKAPVIVYQCLKCNETSEVHGGHH